MIVNIMVECKKEGLEGVVKNLEEKGFVYDKKYDSVPMPDKDTVIIRGAVEEDKISELNSISGVLKVWSDTKIEPF